MKNFAVFIILGLMLALIAFGLVPPVPPVPSVLSVPRVLTSSVNRSLTTVLTPTNVYELTAADVETFLDGIVPLQLDRESEMTKNVKSLRRVMKFDLFGFRRSYQIIRANFRAYLTIRLSHHRDVSGVGV